MRIVFALLLAGCGSKSPPVVMAQGAIVDCPQTPNCVSSLAPSDDEEHAIAPLSWQGTPPSVEDLSAWMSQRRRCEVVDQGQDWIHATCKTAVLRFVDDVVLQIDPSASALQVRSASRVGRSDLGANRDRVEALRAEWQALRGIER